MDLSSQVATIMGQLHGLFDEIGVPSRERESRESELFAALSDTLHGQVRHVSEEKNELEKEAHRIITVVRQMENSINDRRSPHEYEDEDEDLKITYPLTSCLQTLKERHSQISKIHRERFSQVQKLVQALESYSSHLDPSFVRITLPPTSPDASIPPTFDISPSYISRLDNEFTRVYEEYTRRVTTVKALSENIIQFWAELGTPQAQTDHAIISNYRDSPEQLGLREDDIARLRSKRDRLSEERKSRERRLKELRTLIEALWERLGIEEHEQRSFLNNNRGFGVRQINNFEDELAKLNELKRQNLDLFVEDARYKLQELWDGLYFSEEEMLEFAPAFSDVYSDALLEAHEREIERLEALKEQRAPMLALVEHHRSLVKDRNDLSAASQDASRLMMRGQKGEKRDPTRLLREEKMRKRIAKELPRVTADLRKALEQWEDEFGRPFMVLGERYMDEVEASEVKPASRPRSRTPGAPTAAASKMADKAQKPPSRPNSSMRPASSRSGARTPAGQESVRRNPMASSTSTTGGGPNSVMRPAATVRGRPNSVTTAGRTPSKVPGRIPLSTIKHGNSSPGLNTQTGGKSDNSTVSKMHPPAHAPTRAPPPKMRNLIEPPEALTPPRSASVESNGIVRPVSPEDVYYDGRDSNDAYGRPHSKYSSLSSSSSMRQDERAPQYLYPPQSASSRQTSNTSASTTTMSGSENWETYDDVSEPEQDVSREYYARLQAARGKRFSPDDGHASSGPQKKQKGYPPVPHAGCVVTDAHGNRIISGSEDNWDEGDAY